MSRPDSAKTMAQMPSRPTLSISSFGIERAAGRHDACEHRARLVAAPSAPESGRRPDSAVAPSAALGLVPLAPAHAGPAGGLVGEAAHGTGEAADPAVRCDQLHRREGHRLDGQAQVVGGERGREREAVVAEELMALDRRERAQRPAGRLLVARWRTPRRRRAGCGWRGSGCRPRGGRPSTASRASTSPARPRSGPAGPTRRSRCARRPRGSRRAPGTGPRSGSRGGTRRCRRRSPTRGRARTAPGHRAASRTPRPGRRRRWRTPRSRGSCGRAGSRRCGRPTGPRCGSPSSARRAAATSWSITVTSGRPSPTRQAQYQARPQVRVQPEPHVAAEGALGVREVEVPGLVPELLVARLVAALVGGRRRGDRLAQAGQRHDGLP